MAWIDRGRDKLAALGKSAKPKAGQLRDTAAPRVQAAKKSAEKAGASARTRLDDIAQAFREGASGEDDPEKATPQDPNAPRGD